jgi:hypothetical protein
MATHSKTPTKRSGQAGFTLVELLAASVFGAMLLTALAYATTQFVIGVTHMEQQAGFSNSEAKILRRMTREIREAWWVEIVNTERLRVADADNQISEYYLDGTDLKVLRPNGDQGVLLPDLAVLDFEGAGLIRRREGAPTSWDSALYTRALPGTAPLALEVPQGGRLSLAFQAPVVDDDLPSGGVPGDEALLSMSMALLTIPLAWVPDTSPANLLIEVYESWGPGSARPLGSALGSVQIPGSALPAAIWNGSEWDVPASSVSLSVTGIASSLEPGTGYTVVLSANGNAQMVTEARPEFTSSSNDDVALYDGTPGTGFAPLMVAVPFTVSGPYTLTSSVDTEIVATVSIQLEVEGKALQIRSATLIGQSLSENPWAGVVPGEPSP